MTQPDLVSKLREVIAKWRKQATWEHNHSVKQRDAGDLDDEGYITAGARMFQLEECSDSLESLLGLEGQATRTFDEWWLSEGINHMPRGDQPPEHAAIARLAWNASQSCGPSQPETVREGYKGICVCGHRSGAHHESDPSCEFCACKSYRDVSAWGGSPSTPIVPSVQADGQAAGQLLKLWLDSFDDGGLIVNEARTEPWYETNLIKTTRALLAAAPPEQGVPIVPGTPDDPRFDGIVVEVAEEFAILEEDIPTLRRILARLPSTAGLSAEQVREVIGDPNMKYNQKVADRLNALLGAAKPAEPGVPLIHGRAELDIHDARIRKSVLEEAAQVIEKDCDMWKPQNLDKPIWSWKDMAANHRSMSSAIRALAERPAPAGEVKGEK